MDLWHSRIKFYFCKGKFGVSEVKTDSNYLFKAFAFSDVAADSLPFSLRGETPDESRFTALKNT